MPEELYLTMEGLRYLQEEDIEHLQINRQQIYSEAPLSDLLAILDLEHRIGRRNLKIWRLEGITDDLPF